MKRTAKDLVTYCHSNAKATRIGRTGFGEEPCWIITDCDWLGVLGEGRSAAQAWRDAAGHKTVTRRGHDDR